MEATPNPSNTNKYVLSSTPKRKPKCRSVPQKMEKRKFDDRIESLLSYVKYTEIVYEKTVLGFHHIIVVNWKIFEQEILGGTSLWGRSRHYSTFNREVLIQGYQKIKLQIARGVQKVLVYLRSVRETRAPLSHLPCFIPIEEIKQKQKTLEVKYKETLRTIRQNVRQPLRVCRNNCVRNGKAAATKSKSTMTDEIIREFDKLDYDSFAGKNSDGKNSDAESNTTSSDLGNIILDFIASDILDESINTLLTATIAKFLREDELLWDPNVLSEREVTGYLATCFKICDHIPRARTSPESTPRYRDNEKYLTLLHKCGYQTTTALNTLRNSSSDGRVNGNFKTNVWTSQQRLTFEKGLIQFGENVDVIFDRFDCFKNLQPLDLDMYFYSQERQSFIDDPAICRKIVDILDRTSHKHLQSIESFEVSMDWARMRQNVLSSSSESESYIAENSFVVNQYGRTVKQSQAKKIKKRPKRLPNRFNNFHM